MKTDNSQTCGDEINYHSEESLADDWSRVVVRENSPVQCREVAREFDYASGRTDLVGLDPANRLHAFELKLSKWRKALDQARRNTCFAHYCYVVLPARSAQAALKAQDEFERHGIGLVILNGNVAALVVRPRWNPPLLPWLTEVALEYLGQE
jgi:hypothetical protein